MKLLTTACAAAPLGRDVFLIAEAVRALHQAPYVELRSVQCRVEGKRCVLLGRVTSFYLKQVAQNVLCNRLGDRFQVDNRLEVQCRMEELLPSEE
jgi:hypothetical protein